MTREPDAFGVEIDLEPELSAVVDAILDGRPVDWTAAESGGSTDPTLASQFRALADIAALHRTLARGEPPMLGPHAVLSDAQTSWGHLRRLEKVGQGAFGEVFRAWDPHLSREVALKLIDPVSDHTADSRSWILEEARFLAAIRHPNVVTVYGADRIDGRVGFWTEFIRGQTLAALVNDHGTLAPSNAAAIGIDLCRAVSAVHAAGLLHRDIKASNVMREDGGRIVLLDFGATRDFLGQTTAQTSSGDEPGPTGTPLYVAPELWKRSVATPQSDIYSLGVLLYFLVTGSYPVRGGTARDVGDAHRAGRRVSLRDERPDLPAPFSEVVEQAIDPDPSRRFASIDTLQHALDRVLSAEMVSRAAGRRWSLRSVAAVAAVLPFVGIATTVSWLPNGEGDVPAPAPPQAPPAASTPASRPTSSSSPAAKPAAPAARTAIPALKKITIPDILLGNPSRDGRFYPYVDDEGNIQVFEVATGQSHSVTRKNAGETAATWFIDQKGGRLENVGFRALAVMSPTGDRVAYSWSLPNDFYELRLAGADGTRGHALLERRDAYQPVPVDWSSDGRQILCWLIRTDGGADLVLVPAEGGPPNLLFTKTGSTAGGSLSPDGRYVVFPHWTGRDPKEPELVLLPTDGGVPRPLFPRPIAGRSARWIDDRHVFFLRPTTLPEYPDALDGWIAQVVDGVAQGEPAQAIQNYGAVPRADIIGNRFVSFPFTVISNEVHVASIDLTGQKSPGPPSRISPSSLNRHLAPTWSPDGNFIAYFTARPSGTAARKDFNELTIQNQRTGEETTVKPKLAFVGGYSPQWLPGGRYVIVWGRDQETSDRFGYYRVDVRTGDANLLALASAGPGWSQMLPNGNGFLYRDAERGIVSKIFETDAEKVVVPRSKWAELGRFGLSRDGLLAFSATISDAGRAIDVLEVQTLDGAPREVHRTPRPDFISFQSWTPDGHHLLYGRRATEGIRLWMVPRNGGDSRDMQLTLTAVNPISLSPDGSRMTYAQRILTPELWIRPLPSAKQP